MIGTTGAIRSEGVVVHHVPLVACPVCHKVEVHHAVREEFDLLVEYAQGDGARHVNFKDYVASENMAVLMENCTSVEGGNPVELYQEQIDHALDLLGVSKQLNDSAWEQTLKERLKVLTKRLNRHRKARARNG